MKDFYRFIKSQDIREHLEKIGYEMSTAECAYVVYESLLPLADKHEAYKEIIESMSDVQLPDKGGSLHEALKTKAELENILMDVFEQSDKAVYMYRYIDSEQAESHQVYADWRRCLEEAFGWRADAEFVRIEKKWITAGDEDGKTVSVLFNQKREAVNVSSRGILSSELNEKFWIVVSAGAYAHIPLPFKRGDILHTVTDGVFVYESEPKKYSMAGYMADNSGGIGLYAVDRLDAEYYTKKLEEKDRKLKAISLYLKGKIDLAKLIERCKD